MSDISPVILWFRDDLRLNDHRALKAACDTGAPIIPVFILDDGATENWSLGSASRWWLAHSLSSLQTSLSACGVNLILRRGATRDILETLVEESKSTAIYFTRSYEPWAVALEHQLKEFFDTRGVSLKRYGGRLLREPEDLRTKTGDVYKVYTPFWRALSASYVPAPEISAPKKIISIKVELKSEKLDDWKLVPSKPNWAVGFQNAWQPGEHGAHKALETFLTQALATYTEDRNRPDKYGTSRLSPHLHFGEISAVQCWRAAVAYSAKHKGVDKGLETFLKEIVWREFSHSLLFHWPDLPEQPFRKDFSAFPWAYNSAHLKAWQRGQTGYPIVDAGMCELWHTGYMHNRVRMIVASFLIKHLLIPWQEGEAWFWDTLLDADLANNAASWQWVAGSGADAAPYFRIFNPITQGEKFDPDGVYVRRWVPELSKLPTTVLHAPWTAPDEILKLAGITLGKNYPKPIVDHATARERALRAYDAVKRAAAKTE